MHKILLLLELKACTYYSNVQSPGGNQQTPIGRLPSGDSVSGQILNMFNTDSQLTLLTVSRRLWRVGRHLHNARTHTPIVEELSLELTLESAAYGSESANSNANP